MSNRNTQKDLQTEEWIKRANDDELSLGAIFVFLNDFYVITRYPGDYPTFSMKEAKQAYEAALRVKDFVLEKIK